MTTLELKNTLIHQIASIDDKSFLTAIKTILENHVAKKVYKTSPEEEEMIKLGLEELNQGKGIPHEEVKKEIEQWLDEK